MILAETTRGVNSCYPKVRWQKMIPDQMQRSQRHTGVRFMAIRHG